MYFMLNQAIFWDEKKVVRDGKEDVRLVVLIGGDERPPKAIGSFPIADGKAETVSNEVIKQTKKWGVGNEPGETKPCVTLWDNASSNSGIK